MRLGAVETRWVRFRQGAEEVANERTNPITITELRHDFVHSWLRTRAQLAQHATCNMQHVACCVVRGACSGLLCSEFISIFRGKPAKRLCELAFELAL